MDPQLPTSFIPKRPVVAGVPTEQHSSRAVGLLSLVTAIVVIATLLSFVFVFLYQRSLSTQKEKFEQMINDARNGVGTDFLADMKRLNARIIGVKTLLDKHIVVTPIFEALQATTLRSVQYKSFSYQFVTDPTTKEQMVRVSLNGVAKNYTTIALQSDAFAQSSLIKNPVFSDLNVDDKGESVLFKLTFDVSPSDLSFASFVASHNLGSIVQTPQSPLVEPTSAVNTTSQ
jgi:hypothetical protein